MSFADKVKKMVNEAPVASSGVNVNFGPLTVTPIVLRWNGRGAGARPEKTPLAEYMRQHGLKESDDVELAPGESFQLHFDIDISELNPSLDFHYEREIAILLSSPKVKTSWSEIVQPSLEKVFGKNWEEKILPNGKKSAPVVYVAAEAVDPVEPVKEGKKTYSVPRFIAAYPSLEACREARDERYPPRDTEAEMAFGPEGDDEELEEGEFPQDVIEQVQELFNSTRKNRKQTLKMLENKPLGDYDAEELFKAALPDVK
jgi:hypothetical protein